MALSVAEFHSLPHGHVLKVEGDETLAVRKCEYRKRCEICEKLTEEKMGQWTFWGTRAALLMCCDCTLEEINQEK
jgi:hypothetical protein